MINSYEQKENRILYDLHSIDRRIVLSVCCEMASEVTWQV